MNKRKENSRICMVERIQTSSNNQVYANCPNAFANNCVVSIFYFFIIFACVSCRMVQWQFSLVLIYMFIDYADPSSQVVFVYYLTF